MSSTLVTFLLDRSGSMQATRGSTIESFNAYLAGLQEEKDAAIDFTFLQFDTEGFDKLCVATPVGNVSPLTEATFIPRGGTPLIDAAFKTIKAVEDAVAREKQSLKIVVCIQTDGQENSSTEHTWEELKALIERRAAEGWQFNFMGAGIDAYAQGAKMGIAAMNTMSYDHADKVATRAAFSASAENARSFAAGRLSNTSYSAAQRTSAGDRFAPGDLGGVSGLAPDAPVAARPAKPRRSNSLDLTAGSGGSAGRRQTVPDISL